MSFRRRQVYRSASCLAAPFVVVSLPSSERNPVFAAHHTHPASKGASGNRSTAGSGSGNTIADVATFTFDFSTLAIKKTGLTTIDTTLGTIGILKEDDNV